MAQIRDSCFSTAGRLRMGIYLHFEVIQDRDPDRDEAEPVGAISPRIDERELSPVSLTRGESIWGDSPMRWVGIDEAGYGPNLGPMVMTAVIAESTEPGRRRRACAATRSISGATWRRPSIEPAVTPTESGSTIPRRSSTAARDATGSRSPAWRRSMRSRHELPGCLGELIEVLGAGSLADIELARWSEAGTEDRAWPPTAARDALDALVARRPFVPPVGRLADRRGELGRRRTGRVQRRTAKSTARKRPSISRPSTGCSSRSGTGPPMVGPRSSRATSTAGGTTTCSRSRRLFPKPGSIAAPRART